MAHQKKYRYSLWFSGIFCVFLFLCRVQNTPSKSLKIHYFGCQKVVKKLSVCFVQEFVYAFGCIEIFFFRELSIYIHGS